MEWLDWSLIFTAYLIQMIPNYSTKELYNKFFAMGVTQYGQMTAGTVFLLYSIDRFHFRIILLHWTSGNRARNYGRQPYHQLTFHYFLWDHSDECRQKISGCGESGWKSMMRESEEVEWMIEGLRHFWSRRNEWSTTEGWNYCRMHCCYCRGMVLSQILCLLSNSSKFENMRS